MGTSSKLLTAEALPAAGKKRSLLPATWVTYGQAFSRWAVGASVIVTGLLGWENDIGVGRPASFVVLALVGFAFVSLGDGLVSLLWKLAAWLLPRLHLARVAGRLHSLPPAMVGRMLGVFILIAGDSLWPNSVLRNVRMPPVGEIAIVSLAISGVLLSLARTPGRPRPRRLMFGGMAVVLNAAYLAWVLWPGVDGYLAQVPNVPVSSLGTLSNPGLPGRYPVQRLTYGSGSSRHRAEFGAEADLLTEPVDGSQLFSFSGLGGRYLRWYWGFDSSRLPLNGLVWYPEGEGPFPLVLIVHGNHAATEASDPGYAYLGEHLASHGYITVSVDENFLNGILFFDGGMAELPLRGWLLLKHLQVWRSWNEMPGNPFYGRVDLARIAVIGHSRGGEAVAVAAAMDQQPAAISDVTTSGDFGFGIKAVVAIAPSDGHYQPAGRPLTLRQNDYLLLAGGHDADTYVLYGQAQYNRVHLGDNPDGFKALAYLYQANHGNFNSVWADRDRGLLNSLLLNRRPLLPGEAQRQSARVLITAFLDASLRGERRYRALFVNPPAGNAWLPPGILVTQYADASFAAVDTNRPHTTASRLDNAGGKMWTKEVSAWETTPLLLRDGTSSQQNDALYLAWAAESAPVAGMVLANPVPITPGQALTFNLAPAPTAAGTIGLAVEVETAAGESARLPLSQFGPVTPPLPAQLLKAAWLLPLPGYEITLESPVERVLQTYTLPLDAFRAVNAGLEDAAIQEIRFVFDGTQAGAVYLDDVGLVVAPEGARQ